MRLIIHIDSENISKIFNFEKMLEDIQKIKPPVRYKYSTNENEFEINVCFSAKCELNIYINCIKSME